MKAHRQHETPVYGTHVYDWDQEPHEERPSGFASTGFAGLSGYHPEMDPMRRRRPPSRFGFRSAVAVALALVVIGTLALRHVVRALA